MAKATPQQIQEWKDKYGTIFEIKSEKDESAQIEEKYGYLKQPDRKIMALASSMQSVPVRSNEALLKGCWVGGDTELKDIDKYFLAVQGQLAPLMEVANVTITKL